MMKCKYDCRFESKSVSFEPENYDVDIFLGKISSSVNKIINFIVTIKREKEMP